MTFRSRTLFIIFCIVSIIGLIHQWVTHGSNSNRNNASKKVAQTAETIDFQRVQRNCVCADWVKANELKNPKNGSSSEFFFIQPSSPDLAIPASRLSMADSGYIFRLQGYFSNEKDLPANYQNFKDPKPEKARIFYYNSFEVVKQE
ncbi:MAG: hypothetical protein C5B59_04875 [Bacteroidetes bacterium]|nr:MAG: hypothetical protein C5B59_04875 [Bacteroidota bacterium]